MNSARASASRSSEDVTAGTYRLNSTKAPKSTNTHRPSASSSRMRESENRSPIAPRWPTADAAFGAFGASSFASPKKASPSAEASSAKTPVMPSSAPTTFKRVRKYVATPA